MTEQAGTTTGIQVARAWQGSGEDGSVHVQFTAGDDDVQIKLQRARNPRLYEFIMKHAELSSAPEHDDDDADEGAAPVDNKFS